MRVVMIIEMSWQVNEEVIRDVTGEADGINHGVDSRDGVNIWMSDLWFSMRRWSAVEKEWQQMRSGYCKGLNRDQIAKIARLTGCKNFVGKRKKWIFNAFIYFVGYGFLFAFHSNYGRIFSHFEDIQHQRMAGPWNLGLASFKVIENGAVR